jgi:hypothetical protein
MSNNFEELQKSTFSLMDMWLKNFARNLPYILEGNNIKDLSVFQNEITYNNHNPTRTSIIIGKGPSVYEKNHLEILSANKENNTIVCSDIMLIETLKKGITPDKFDDFYVLTVDGEDEQVEFYDDPIVEEYSNRIKVILSTCTSPKVTKVCKKFGLNVFWFNPLIDDFRKEGSFSKIMNIMTRSENNPKGISSLQTGGNVASNSWVFSWAILGRSPIVLIGVDFGYPASTSIEETQHYQHLLKCYNNDVDRVKNGHRIIHNKDFDCDVLLDPIYDYYREGFCNMVIHTPKWLRTINATEGGSLFGENIETMKFSEFLKINK